MLIRSFIFAIMFFAVSSARAELALTFTGGNPGLALNTWGWSFTTDNTITITSLGWWDQGNDGLTDSHQVAIWDMSGNELVSGTVSAGTADPLISGFRFNSLIIGTTTLEPGAYVIGGLSSLHDHVTAILEPYGPNGGNGTVTLGSGISYIHTRTNESIDTHMPGYSFPAYEERDDDYGVFGPTFQYSIGAGPSPVPEPSTMLLGSFVGLILGAHVVRRLKKRPAEK